MLFKTFDLEIVELVQLFAFEIWVSYFSSTELSTLRYKVHDLVL